MGEADASVSTDARADVVLDARSDVARTEAGACCGSTVLNEDATPQANCFQGATYLAFAVTPSCDVPLGRIEVHTRAITLGLLASGDTGPGAILVPPTIPTTPQPGWSSISPGGVTLLKGVKYYVMIGNDHLAPGVGCDYADVGDDVEYWGGEPGNFAIGPFYAPYIARLVAVCK